jgi:type IV pilus assembly protein PilM
VIGVGNGFKLAGLQKFLQQNLQYEVERPDTYKALAGDAVLNAPLFADNVLSFAVSYGLALQVLGQTTIRTSLLPPEIVTARKVRKKKPWAVATAACLLLGYAISTMGNANSYAKPHSDAFEAAKQKAEQLTKTVADYKAAYDGEGKKFTDTQAELDKVIAGRRDLTWLDGYNAVIDCLPRDEGDEQDVTEIEKRELISITSFTAEKKADVGEWYTKLTNEQKYYMTQEDKDKAPSGEGYIVTLMGQHWHYNESDPLDRGLSYLVNKFLRKLQQQTVEVPGYPTRDVRRMGITHAAVIDKKDSLVTYDPLGVLKPSETGTSGYPMGSNPGFAPFAPPAVPRVSTVPGQVQPDEVRQIKQFDFKIQFVFQPIPVEERAEIVVETTAEEPAAVETNALDPGTTPDPAEASPATAPTAE